MISTHGSHSFRTVLLVAVLLLALVHAVQAAAPPLVRRANTSLKMPPRPPTYGYDLVNAFSGVSFTAPMAIAVPPGETNRLFVVERAGRVAVITNLAAPSRRVFIDISSKIDQSRDGGLQAMAFHPGFATNGFFYLFYTGPDTTPTPGGTNTFHDVLSRFTAWPPTTNAASAATEWKMLRQKDRESDHNGCDMHFGADGYLYVSLGDEGSPGAVGYDYYTNSQYIDRSFFSAIMRIDVDMRPGNLEPNPHPAVVTNAYRVPADNPWVGATNFNGLPVDPAKVRTEFWAVGLRNPFRFSFDDATGLLYCGDVGQKHYEEINVITRGGNYGWIWREGAHPTTLLDGNPIARPIPPGFTNYIEPVREIVYGTGTSKGQCVIGGVVYRGAKMSQLYGHYVFGDYKNGNVWAFKYDGASVTGFTNLTSLGTSTLVDFGTDPRNGDVLVADVSGNTIWRLIYDTNLVSGAALPATLFATGAFTNTATLTPHSGVVPYDINVPFWSDNAFKSRWFSIPNTNLDMTFSPTNFWLFPTGTVWIKHFDLELTNGVPASARRVETRFTVKNAEGIYGVTYRWGTQTTNATLVPEEGMDENFVIRNPAGGILYTQAWRYPSRLECLQCHTPGVSHAPGFNTPQLNLDRNFAGTVTNQLQALADAGYFSNAVALTAGTPALAHATNTAVPLEFRVRSYFAANCVSCHLPGGLPEQVAQWDARITTPLAAAGVVNGALIDDFGNTNARVVKLGSLTNSVLYLRVASLGAAHMPPLATAIVNTQAVSLLAEWINTIPSVRVSEMRPLPDGSFQFTLTGLSGWTGIIEAATNLISPAWLPVGTNVFDTNHQILFVDPAATNHPARFYRTATP